ncbi:MAG: hypothetical protein CM1200mP26_02480 [Acidimicrobiales bacterium]|nr:MAG: hypothetical protein CM1200mP26_02480 [Acidimicrobiales bacterium]
MVGVIPTGLFSHEVPHRQLTERIEVADMHERKRTMYARSDAFCGLPGGYGTLEEVFEAATWNQLGLHDRPKPIAPPRRWGPRVARLLVPPREVPGSHGG